MGHIFFSVKYGCNYIFAINSINKKTKNKKLTHNLNAHIAIKVIR